MYLKNKELLMKKMILIAILIIFNTNNAFAEFYSVYIKRIEKDLYKDLNSGIYIVTKWCYEYTYGENAILSYEPYSFDNKLIFDNSNTCDVDELLK